MLGFCGLYQPETNQSTQWGSHFLRTLWEKSSIIVQAGQHTKDLTIQILNLFDRIQKKTRLKFDNDEYQNL